MIKLLLVYAGSLAHLIISRGRSRVAIWTDPRSFHLVEKARPSEAKITSLSYGKW